MKRALPQPESSPQNGGGGGGGGPSIWEPGGGGGAAPEETATEATASVSQEQPRDSAEAGATALPKGPEEPERPVRRIFQIPRKSREKKGGASLPPNPSSSLPSIFPLESLVSSSHTHPRRKHAGSAGRPAAALRGERQAGAPRSSVPPLPVEAGSSSGLKRFCKEKMVLGAPPSTPAPEGREAGVPPQDASEKSHCGSSPWPWILELSPRPCVVQRISSASPCGSSSALMCLLEMGRMSASSLRCDSCTLLFSITLHFHVDFFCFLKRLIK